MRNNSVLRRLRYIFDFSDVEMVRIFQLAGVVLDRSKVEALLAKDSDQNFISCSDQLLCAFLDGMIVDKRGKRDGKEPIPEKHLSNNQVLRKLKIGMDLREEDMLDIMHRANFRLSRHELSAFFRKKGHKNFRICKDQVLRNFLNGLQLKYHGGSAEKNSSVWK